MSIGQLAQETGVSSRTIRYYEELGILPHPPRSQGGTRRYPPEFRFYVEGALALKELGFSLDDIRLLGQLALGQGLSPHDRSEAVEIVSENMARLEHKIQILERLRGVLTSEHRGKVEGTDEVTWPGIFWDEPEAGSDHGPERSRSN